MDAVTENLGKRLDGLTEITSHELHAWYQPWMVNFLRTTPPELTAVGEKQKWGPYPDAKKGLKKHINKLTVF